MTTVGNKLQKLPQTGREARELIRLGKFPQPTSGTAPDHVQTNLAVIPKNVAFEFMVFCQRNPKPCPIIEVLEPGNAEAMITAPGSDLRTDISLYRVYRDGELVDEPNDLSDWWRKDLVAFLLGCSFTFEHALIRNGIELPYFGTDKGVSMFTTNLNTVPSGPFSGPMVVSQRWIPTEKVVRAVQATSRYPGVHGAPVHIGDPAAIGIDDPLKPDFGDSWPPANETDVPVYWACGVTPQAVAMACRPELMITHSPGHMFVTDLIDEDLAII